MRLHVITAVSRPENLPAIAESLARAAQNAPGVQIAWHWRYDLDRQHVGGQALKNAMLDVITDDWVWALDDDTLAHEDVLVIVAAACELDPEADAIIVSQLRTTGEVLLASPERMCPGGVDIGQAFLRRRLLDGHRIPEDYNGDGMFLEAVLQGAKVRYLSNVVSLHNALSGVPVSA